MRRGHGQPIRAVAIRRGRVVFVGDDEVVAWRDGRTLGSRMSAESVTSLAIAVDVDRVAFGDGGGALRIWDLDTGDVLAAHDHHDGAITAVGLSNDGDLVYTGGADGAVHRLDVPARRTSTFRLEQTSITGLAVLDDHSVLLTTGDSDVWHWADFSRGPSQVHREHRASMTIGWGPSGPRVSSRRYDRVWLWDQATDEVTEGPADWVMGVPSRDGIVTAGRAALKVVVVDEP